MKRSVARQHWPQQIQRETNIGIVLRTLREQGPASRSELAEKIGIDRSTMTSIASELVAAGLVREAEGPPPGSTGGRRRKILTLAAGRVVSAGLELDDERAVWVLCDLNGETMASGTIDRVAADLEAWIERALHGAEVAIHSWRSTQKATDPIIAGVGIGIPGLYDPDSRVLRESIVLGCRDLRLGELRFEADVRIEPCIDNDANCCAWNIADAESTTGTTIFVQLKLHRGAHGEFRDSVAGVGLSFVMDGRVYYGSSHAAGELRGYRWTNGRNDQLGLEPSRVVTVEAIIRELLQNLGVIASAFDPSRIVLGGDLSSHASLVSDAFDKDLASTAAARFYRSGVLLVAAPGAYSVSEGAARMVLHELFSLPALHERGSHKLRWRALLDRLESSKSKSRTARISTAAESEN